MKYMGSKRMMLQNGLGEVLDREIASAVRFVDLFSGTGAVATYVAQQRAIVVRAIDTQEYSVALTNAILRRNKPFRSLRSWNAWLGRAAKQMPKRVMKVERITHAVVKRSRDWCKKRRTPITRAYGGYYFSPEQATWPGAVHAT